MSPEQLLRTPRPTARITWDHDGLVLHLAGGRHPVSQAMARLILATTVRYFRKSGEKIICGQYGGDTILVGQWFGETILVALDQDAARGLRLLTGRTFAPRYVKDAEVIFPPRQLTLKEA